MPLQHEPAAPVSVSDAARRAKLAAGALAALSGDQKDQALLAVASALEERATEILHANALDLAAARELVDTGAMSESIYQRLELSETKLRGLVAGIERLATLDDPVGHTSFAMELDHGLRLDRVTCPIGVVGVIFESRPDALPQIVALCLKSGNAILLKGGSEAQRSNRTLADVITSAATAAGIPTDAVVLLESREDVAALLGTHESVDLIIPRGSSALVRHIQANTIIPVLGHAEGICHVYVDAAADLEKALDIVIDAKVQYPAACNAAETLLVHRAVAARFLPEAVAALQRRGVEVRCDVPAHALLNMPGEAPATDADWAAEYGDLVLAVRVVDSLEEAIRHINTYGSRHTETIVTDDQLTFERFFAEVDAAGVFLNASTRFADGYRYGFGAEVGISTGKLHPRGPVGIDGLVTYKYRLVGDGHIVARYSGAEARPFLHQRLDTGHP
jgi:glutamate-5-semialdehyde dehydrogenase